MSRFDGGGSGGRGEAACGKQNEKSFRETPKPLKSLKTAKSGYSRTQGYQRLSNTHDFAGEMISFRFGSFSFRAKW